MIIGIDEVGRGALAGPVVVGAVSIYAQDQEEVINQICKQAEIKKLRDSKKLLSHYRERVFDIVCNNNDVRWSIGECDVDIVNTEGLSMALRKAAGIAIAPLLPTDQILADAGLFHPFEREISTERIVKGDEKVFEIMLASIMAKVYRDRKMIALANEFPQYAFEHHVGYSTQAHRLAIRKLGLTPHHRIQFCRSALR